MAEFTTDFSNTHAFTNGHYAFMVESVDPPKQKDKGPYFGVNLRIVEAPSAGDVQKAVKDYISLSEGGLWRAKQFLESLGYEVPEGTFRFNTDDLPGGYFRAECEVEKAAGFAPKLRIVEYMRYAQNGAGGQAPAGGGTQTQQAAPPQQPQHSVAPQPQAAPPVAQPPLAQPPQVAAPAPAQPPVAQPAAPPPVAQPPAAAQPPPKIEV